MLFARNWSSQARACLASSTEPGKVAMISGWSRAMIRSFQVHSCYMRRRSQCSMSQRRSLSPVPKHICAVIRSHRCILTRHTRFTLLSRKPASSKAGQVRTRRSHVFASLTPSCFLNVLLSCTLLTWHFSTSGFRRLTQSSISF